MEKFDIDFPGSQPQRCVVAFGRDTFSDAAEFIAGDATGGRVAVVSDENVAALYGGKLTDLLGRAGLVAELITFPAGEGSKNWGTLGLILEQMAAAGIGRDGAVAALGGGVSGDLAGAAAALYCRGIPWTQLPTTSLSMADSAIGGKTGVNINGVKNLAGAFHQPRAVFADLDTLASLPRRHLVAGLAEVVKMGLMFDAEIFELLESNPAGLSDPEGSLLEWVLSACARLKGEVVARDEREAGERALLNAGHTIGHAVEAASRGELLHGEAVAIGMSLECRLAERLVGFTREQTKRVLNLLSALGLPREIPRGLEKSAIRAFLKLDKKNKGGELRFALPAAIGGPAAFDGAWTLPVNAELLDDGWRYFS